MMVAGQVGAVRPEDERPAVWFILEPIGVCVPGLTDSFPHWRFAANDENEKGRA